MCSSSSNKPLSERPGTDKRRVCCSRQGKIVERQSSYLVTSISMIFPTTTIDLHPSPLRSLPKNLRTYLFISHFSLSENKNGLNHNWFLSKPLLPHPPPHQNRKLDLGFPQHKPIAMDFASQNSSNNCDF